MAYGYYKLFYGIREKKYVLNVAPLIYSILLHTGASLVIFVNDGS